eukprot:m.147870 g.147870  ORF g.147870 m.147870 type:complete len:818 (+) comp14196_c0_seq3:71-2524(+)
MLPDIRVAIVLGLVGQAMCLRHEACADTPGRPPPPPLPRGVLSVVEHFGADPTGKADATASLQQAVVTARTHNITLFMPFGCYMVTDTINATEPRNGRWQPVVIVGQRPTDSWPHRPTIVLPPNSPLFQNSAVAKPVIVFTTNWCLAPGSDEANVATGCTSNAQPQHDWHSSAYQFNQVLQSVDIAIGLGNPSAVGINMNAAQGTTLEDVTVFAAEDALAGVAGGNGGGGSFKGVTVIGARYGIDSRATGDAPTMVAVKLVNQSCAGLLHGSTTTVIATGFRIIGSPAIAGVLAGVDPSMFGLESCQAPTASDLGFSNPSPNTALHSAASLVDSTISLTSGGTTPCVIANSSLYMSDVFVSGCHVAVASGGRAPLLSVAAHSHVSLLGYGRLGRISTNPNQMPYEFAFPAYLNGTRSAEGFARIASSPQGPPLGLDSRHWLSEGMTWQSPNAISALDVGCKGDGATDDWAPLQAALDAHDIVVLPKGLYRLSQPLVLRRSGGALIGVGRTISVLMPTTGADWGERPLVTVTADDVTVGFVSLIIWDHVPLTFALKWQGTNGVWRQAWFNRMTEKTFPPFSAVGQPKPSSAHPGVSINRALSEISGGGAFYDFNLDFGCCFGTALPPPSVPVPPDTASSGEVWLQGPAYRTVLVNGSVSGLRFYPLNAEQDFGEAHTEISWSHNVTMYGAKSENNYAVLWIRDSNLVTVHGYGGNAAAFANHSADNVRQDGRVAQYMPSLFRVQRSTAVRFANLIDAGRVTSQARPSVFVAAGNGTDPRLWNMVLYQDGNNLCDPKVTPANCSATQVLDRPVVWEWVA